VRHPLEVAASLSRRTSISTLLALRLWEAYNQQALRQVPPHRRVVTHYASYLFDAPAEIRRLLAALNVRVPDDVVRRAATAVSPGRQRHRAASLARDASLPENVARLYARLCAEAGPVLEQAACQPATAVAASEPARPAGDVSPVALLESILAEQVLALHDVRLERARLTEALRVVRQSQAQLSAAQHRLQASLTARERQLQATQHIAAVASAEVESLHRSRFFRLARLYWDLRARVGRRRARPGGRS
jgi:hypothetical protein